MELPNCVHRNYSSLLTIGNYKPISVSSEFKWPSGACVPVAYYWGVWHFFTFFVWPDQEINRGLGYSLAMKTSKQYFPKCHSIVVVVQVSRAGNSNDLDDWHIYIK